MVRESRTNAVVFTGLQGAGVTTCARLCSEFADVVFDPGDIDRLVEQRGMLAVSDGAPGQSFLDELDDIFDDTLVIRVTAPQSERRDRVIRRELDNYAGTVDTGELEQVRSEFKQREQREQDEITHHVTIENPNDLRTAQLQQKLSALLTVIQ